MQLTADLLIIFQSEATKKGIPYYFHKKKLVVVFLSQDTFQDTKLAIERVDSCPRFERRNTKKNFNRLPQVLQKRNTSKRDGCVTEK